MDIRDISTIEISKSHNEMSVDELRNDLSLLENWVKREESTMDYYTDAYDTTRKNYKKFHDTGMGVISELKNAIIVKDIEEKGYTVADIIRMDPSPYHDDNAENRIKWNEFLRAIKYKDFAVGESFQLNGVEFEVVNK